MGKGIIKNLFSASTSKLVDAVGNAIDKNVTSKEEKLQLKNELVDTITEFAKGAYDLQFQAMALEMKGSYLQRNWRPIIMLTFGAVVVAAVFFPISLNEIPAQFWGLLKIGIGGYVAGRSLEKITTDVTTNMDVTFRKKKDR